VRGAARKGGSYRDSSVRVVAGVRFEEEDDDDDDDEDDRKSV
jgi:hypothetical protein